MRPAVPGLRHRPRNGLRRFHHAGWTAAVPPAGRHRDRATALTFLFQLPSSGSAAAVRAHRAVQAVSASWSTAARRIRIPAARTARARRQGSHGMAGRHSRGASLPHRPSAVPSPRPGRPPGRPVRWPQPGENAPAPHTPALGDAPAPARHRDGPRAQGRSGRALQSERLRTQAPERAGRCTRRQNFANTSNRPRHPPKCAA